MLTKSQAYERLVNQEELRAEIDRDSIGERAP